ncbi:hypothetical protein BDU57DRAFT_461575 [Ampelomyces quisqualis]|uniref:Uncharacterized protein n=1 Tax=Ampelomyces quisqualis TaxID=50730 RepID=A0A6A5QAA3_AMPQU|nr:hypothetical protein BDU57DRAFT_461575 [Ampelomyces quisqualis]
MSTESTPSKDRLSPSWIRRPTMWRRKSAHESGLRSTSSGSLSPRPLSSRSNRDESSSARSNSLDKRTSFRGVVNRLRSTSSVSSLGGKSEEIDDNDIHDWFHGFRRYNNQVTTKFSQQQSHDTADLAKATKKLTKNCGGQLIHGLPEAAFDFALLWCPTSELTQRNTKEPSWSWTSLASPVCFPFDPSTCPDISNLPRSSGEIFRSEITNFHIGPPESPYTLRRDKKNPALRITYPPYLHAPRGSDHTVESKTLRFTALIIAAEDFSSEQLYYKDAAIPVCQLFDARDRHCGVIMSHLSSFSAPSSTGPYEFILLSRNLRREPEAHTRRPQNATSHPPGTPIWDGQGFVWDESVVEFDDAVFEEGEWKMVNVMLVRWVGEFAERVAVGRMHEDVWREGGPRRKDVVLR